MMTRIISKNRLSVNVAVRVTKVVKRTRNNITCRVGENEFVRLCKRGEHGLIVKISYRLRNEILLEFDGYKDDGEFLQFI